MAMSPRLLRPRATGWSPKNLPSLGFWYDPSVSSSVTLNGSNVSQLNDLSGNGRNLTQTTAANQPPYSTTALSKACLDYGTSQNSRSLFITSGGDNRIWREMFIVCRYDRAATFLANEGLIGGTTNNNANIGLFADGLGSTKFYTNSLQSIWDWLSINGGAYSYIVVGGGTSGWPVLPAINSLCVLHAYGDADQACNGLMLGSDRNVSSRGWMGLIGETFASEVTLSSLQRTTAINYLKKKWGVT